MIPIPTTIDGKTRHRVKVTGFGNYCRWTGSRHLYWRRRQLRVGPIFIKLGRRVFYAKDDLENYVNSQRSNARPRNEH